jgi:hypothetical protein
MMTFTDGYSNYLSLVTRPVMVLMNYYHNSGGLYYVHAQLLLCSCS